MNKNYKMIMNIEEGYFSIVPENKRKKNKYKIVDWMNNRIFPNKVFETFEDGWDYIYKKFDNEEDHQEYFVVNVNEKERGQIWKQKTINQLPRS